MWTVLRPQTLPSAGVVPAGRNWLLNLPRPYCSVRCRVETAVECGLVGGTSRLSGAVRSYSLFYTALHFCVLPPVSLEGREQCSMVDAGRLPGGREKEGSLLPLLSFFLSHGLIREAQEASRKVHRGAQIEAGRNSLSQMRSPAGRGHRVGQGYAQNLTIKNRIQFLQEKGFLGCTKLGTPFCSCPTLLVQESLSLYDTFHRWPSRGSESSVLPHSHQVLSSSMAPSPGGRDEAGLRGRDSCWGGS